MIFLFYTKLYKFLQIAIKLRKLLLLDVFKASINHQKGGQKEPFLGGTFKILDPKKGGVQKPAQNTGRIHVEKKELKKVKNSEK
jgi:hypothetical protein